MKKYRIIKDPINDYIIENVATLFTDQNSTTTLYNVAGEAICIVPREVLIIEVNSIVKN